MEVERQRGGEKGGRRADERRGKEREEDELA